MTQGGAVSEIVVTGLADFVAGDIEEADMKWVHWRWDLTFNTWQQYNKGDSRLRQERGTEDLEP